MVDSKKLDIVYLLFVSPIYVLLIKRSEYLTISKFENEFFNLFNIEFSEPIFYLFSFIYLFVFFLFVSNFVILKTQNIFTISIYYSIIYLFGVISFFILFRIENYSRLYLVITTAIVLISHVFLSLLISKNKQMIYLLILYVPFGAYLFSLDSSLFLKIDDDLIQDVVTIENQDTQIVQDSKINTSITNKDRYKNFEFKYLGNFDLGKDYVLEKYLICCENLAYEENGFKSVGYLSQINNIAIFMNGTGEIFYFNTSELSKDKKLEFKSIDTNFNELNNNPNIALPGKDSVKDLLVYENNIYASFINEKTPSCYNIEVLRGKLSLNYISFTYFFQYDECVETSIPRFNSHASGGKLVANENKIILTTGDFLDYRKAQDDSSLFGKIISINIQDGNHKVISKGHRNPQGLSKTNISNILIETEHGPKGGDEINLIFLDQFKNYGWPISSKGKHYKDEYYEEYGELAPLNFSHEEYGFEEPLFYFPYEVVGAHGISDVEINHFGKPNSFFVAVLNGRVLYDIEIDINEKSLTSISTFKSSERIRDIEYFKNSNFYLFIYEDSPALGVLRKK